LKIILLLRGEEEGREKGEAKRYMLVQQEEIN
jgi:hypothetical protein